MFSKLKIFLAVVAFVLFGFANPSRAADQPRAADLKIGAIFPLSGGMAMLGGECLRGVQLATDERNTSGGINGQKIVLIKADAVDASQAVSEARRLTSVEGVNAVFGTFASGIAVAATQVTELAGIPYFEVAAAADTITTRGMKYVYRANPPAKVYAELGLDAIEKIIAPSLKVNPTSLKIAVISEDGPFGTMVSTFQKEGAQRRGLNVVQVLPYSAKTVDLSSLILRLKGSNVDIVLQTSYENDTILFFKQAEREGFKPKAVIGTGGGYTLPDTFQALGPRLNGAFVVNAPDLMMNEKGAPGLKAFIANYQKHFDRQATGQGLVCYVGANAFLDILANAHSTDKDKIRSAVLNYRKPLGSDAAGWGYKFAENGQNELSPATLMQWQKGKLVTVYPKAAAIAEPIVSR
jgi:branched-chain amino acid transport system substrate-binding protein